MKVCPGFNIALPPSTPLGARPFALFAVAPGFGATEPAVGPFAAAPGFGVGAPVGGAEELDVGAPFAAAPGFDALAPPCCCASAGAPKSASRIAVETMRELILFARAIILRRYCKTTKAASRSASLVACSPLGLRAMTWPRTSQ